MNELTFKLTGPELEYVLNCLGQRPLLEALPVFEKIKGQVAPQLAPPLPPIDPRE